MKPFKHSYHEHTKATDESNRYINILVNRHAKEEVVMSAEARPENQKRNSCHIQPLKHLFPSFAN